MDLKVIFRVGGGETGDENPPVYIYCLAFLNALFTGSFLFSSKITSECCNAYVLRVHKDSFNVPKYFFST